MKIETVFKVTIFKSCTVCFLCSILQQQVCSLCRRRQHDVEQKLLILFDHTTLESISWHRITAHWEPISKAGSSNCSPWLLGNHPISQMIYQQFLTRRTLKSSPDPDPNQVAHCDIHLLPSDRGCKGLKKPV